MIEYGAKLTAHTEFFVDPNTHQKILFSNLVLIITFHKWPSHALLVYTALFYNFLFWSSLDYI